MNCHVTHLFQMVNQWLNASAGPIHIKDISSTSPTPHPE